MQLGGRLQLRGSDCLFLEVKIEIEPGQTKPIMESDTTATNITTVASLDMFVK